MKVGTAETLPATFLSADEEERQASWYAAQRRELYRQLGFRLRRRILEVGCGTGVITDELAAWGGFVVGVDVRAEALRAASERTRRCIFIPASAERLPFRGGVWDAVVTAFTLMWIKRPGTFLQEAARVLRPGGLFVALAEPDYEAAVDHPAPASSRELVAAAIRGRGGDAALGRKLPGLLVRAGFRIVTAGVLNAIWTPARWAREEETEFAVLRRLLADVATEDEIARLQKERAAAITRGERLYFLPIFYVAAQKD